MKKSAMSKDRLAAAFPYAIQHATREKRHDVSMRCLAKKALRRVVYCSIICLSITSLCNAIEYEYIELLPPGWSQANAIDINDSGTVVGYGSDDTGTQKGFIYSEGEYTELMPPGCDHVVWVFKINNRGEVLMDGYNCILVNGYEECSRKAFLYSDDTYKELLPPGCEEIEDSEDVGDCFTAYDINDSGTVVGKMMKWTGPAPYDYAYRGVIYSEDNYTELKPMWQDGKFADDIFAINDIGTIVRSKTTLIGEIDWHAAVITRGFIYNGRWYTKLFMPWWSVFPSEINNRGVIVGWGLTDGTEKGFIYNKGIHITLLPDGWEWANAYDINESGTVVGRGGERVMVNGDEWILKGFTYSKGEYTEVLPPGWSYAETYHINESGMVVGFGDNNFSWKGFIAVPQEE